MTIPTLLTKMEQDINLERIVYESRRLSSLIELRRLVEDSRYEMSCRFFATQNFMGAEGSQEFQLSRRVREAIIKELDEQLKAEGKSLQDMFGTEKTNKKVVKTHV